MQQRIEYAIRQSAEARERAEECSDAVARNEWLKAAGMWAGIAEQYRVLVKIAGNVNLERPSTPAA